MTDLYAVIGNPIGHTKSPTIHLGFARQTGQDLDYLALEAPLGGFAAKVDAFRAQGALGLNITAPFKLDAFAYATELREAARLAGAVNALKFEGDRVIGDNFDGIGLTNDIQRNLGFPIAGKRVLLLGAGGAARGAILPILRQHPARLVIANRTVEKAQALVGEFSGNDALSAIGFAALADQAPFEIVLNATSASMQGEPLPIPTGSFAPSGLAYDLVYGKGLTPFLRAAQAAGIRYCADGVGMLVEQAAEAFAWWRGVRPDTAPLIEALTIPLV